MDTSETYIKMCEKAEEIQALTENSFDAHGSIFADVLARGVTFLYCDCGTFPQRSDRPDRYIWLPHQDQLQEMVKTKLGQIRTIWRFYDWLKSLTKQENGEGIFINNHLNYESYDQLWLAFVMHELYQKSWDGDEWVKEAL